MVMSVGGIAASEHPLASQAGASVLARGGHTVDAAIAVNAVMGVVAPMMNGIGGDLFAIVYDAVSGELHGINGSGYAPAALTIDGLRASRASREWRWTFRPRPPPSARRGTVSRCRSCGPC